jgi:hypothetical protein
LAQRVLDKLAVVLVALVVAVVVRVVMTVATLFNIHLAQAVLAQSFFITRNEQNL